MLLLRPIKEGCSQITHELAKQHVVQSENFRVLLFFPFFWGGGRGEVFSLFKLNLSVVIQTNFYLG